MTKYDDNYKWIKVKKFDDDEELTLEERFYRLQTHHVEETTFLINEVRKLATALDNLVKQLEAVHDDPQYKSFWLTANNVIGPYRGLSYGDELEKAKEVLA